MEIQWADSTEKTYRAKKARKLKWFQHPLREGTIENHGPFFAFRENFFHSLESALNEKFNKLLPTIETI